MSTKKNKIKTELQEEILVYDMYNNRIQPGDYIVYPARKGNSLYSRTAKVVSVNKRQLEGDSEEIVLKVVMAHAARYHERNKGNWETKLVRTTVSVPWKAIIVPKSYIQNDRRYSCLLDI